MTLLDLGDCEKDLRDHYNISDDKILYMKKMDVYQEGMKIPKIEYSVYYKLNGTNLIPLDLTVCENSKIILSIPIDISENLDKLNTSSEYFNNICYSSKSDSGTDISLKDRKKEFVEGNKTVCQEDCPFADYNSDNKQVNCSCIVKETSNDYKNMNINKTKLYYNFKETNDKKEISNLGITSCSVLTSKENIDELNISSEYYNDICYTTTSESGTDISLKDRQKEFVNGNKTVCQEECDFSEYDIDSQKAKCSCNVKESSSSIIDMNIDKEKLFKNLANIKNNFANINILGCHEILFNKKDILKNIGFMIIIIIILLHIIIIILFYIKKIAFN